MKKIASTCIAISLSAITGTSIASDAGMPSKKALSEAYAGKAYSPYAARNFPGQPLWGDTHLHTSLSFDAGAFGNRVGPRRCIPLRPWRGNNRIIRSTGTAFRVHSTGSQSRIIQTAWVLPMTLSPHRRLLQTMSKVRAGPRAFRAGGQEAVDATLDMIQTFSQGKNDPEMMANYSPRFQALRYHLGRK